MVVAIYIYYMLEWTA